jgi:hypothetical protein
MKFESLHLPGIFAGFCSLPTFHSRPRGGNFKFQRCRDCAHTRCTEDSRGLLAWVGSEMEEVCDEVSGRGA